MQSSPDIIIKPADNGSAAVAIDKERFIFEANRQLGDTTYQMYKQLKTQHITSRDW